jgi:hypothetical protein
MAVRDQGPGKLLAKIANISGIRRGGGGFSATGR